MNCIQGVLLQQETEQFGHALFASWEVDSAEEQTRTSRARVKVKRKTLVKAAFAKTASARHCS